MLHSSHQNETEATSPACRGLTELHDRGIVHIATDGMQGAMPCSIEGSDMDQGSIAGNNGLAAGIVPASTGLPVSVGAQNTGLSNT